MIEAFSDTIGLIYDAAADPAAWPTALHGIVKLFDGLGATLFTRDLATMSGRHVSTWGPDILREFWRLLPQSPLILRRAASPPRAGTVESDRAIVPRSELMRTAWYNDYWRRCGYNSGMLLWLDCQGAHQQYLSTTRPRSIAEFDQGDIELAQLLLPHLRRALLLDQRLMRRGLDPADAGNALDELRNALIILDDASRVVYANLAAERLFAAADGLTVNDGRLCAATRMASAQLEMLLARASGRAEPVPTSGAMPLPRPSGKLALALVAVPLRRQFDWLRPRRGAVCVCIADPSDRSQPPASWLTSIFDLTAAEAEVAQKLGGGADLREISAQLKISYHTTRAHLARIMKKTETKRQAELVRLLSGLPRPAE